MSASGMTLGRRGMQLPIWPIVGVLVVAATIVIGLQARDDLRSARPDTSIQETPRSGAVAPALDVAAIEASAAAVRELPAAPFHSEGRAHEVFLGPAAGEITFPTGLENPGAYGNAESDGGSVETGFWACDHCRKLP